MTTDVAAAGFDPARDEVFGIECEHHYGITTHPIPADGDVGKEVYRLIREAWHKPRSNGGGLHDEDHTYDIEESEDLGAWSRVIIRKNEKSPRFAFNPWGIADGAGAVWFSQHYRLATRSTITNEINRLHDDSARWSSEAERQKDSIRGRKARDKYLRLARYAALEASQVRSRWPEYDGVERTPWQHRLHRHLDTDGARSGSTEGNSAGRDSGIAQPSTLSSEPSS